jgi:myo-inositol-1(or 4)-monophosphatase
MTTDPSSLLPLALRAADAAAEMMRTRRPVSVTEKHDRDLVSDVDVAIERQVRDLLEQATPDIGFLGEEEGQTGGSTRAGWMWTLDPIDGTSNYAHGIPLCATSLALLHGGSAVLGVIDAPFLGYRYHAVEGHGAFAGDRRLTVSATRRMRDAIVAIGDYATGPGADRANEVRLALTVQLAPRVHRLRMIGTAALDLAWVAEGRLDCSVTLGNKPWDTSAGVLIAREAGAKVVDADGSPHNVDSAFTLAAVPGLVDQLILHVSAADGMHDMDRGAAGRGGGLASVLGLSSVLVFEFDGAVCDFSQAMPPDLAEDLLSSVPGPVAAVPAVAAAARSGDPYRVLAAVAGADSGAARAASARLAAAEARAASRAAPSGYVDEVIAACRDSGRTPVIWARQSAQAVGEWLAWSGLDDQVRHVIAPDGSLAGYLRGEGKSLSDGLGSLGFRADESALVTREPGSAQAARDLGVEVIGYARAPADREQLSGAGAGAVLLSLADLTLTLRARPLAR